MRVAWVEHWIRRVEVTGHSMVPTLRAGQRVTAVRRWRHLRDGDVVVCVDPRESQRWLIKRCFLVGTDSARLLGDNPSQSTDSREFGNVPRRSLKWLVVAASTKG